MFPIIAIGRFAVLGAVLLLAPALHAQARPDFSGRWVRVEDSTAAHAPAVATAGDLPFRTGDLGSGWGTAAAPLTITQRADSVIVEYVFFSSYDLQPPVRLAYAVDGAESVNSVMIGHATSVQRARLAWNGATLVITTDYPLPRDVSPARTIAVRQTLALESPATLTIETRRAGLLGAAPTTVTTRYARAAAR